MTATPLAFTKLVVNDLDRMADYYRTVCGLTDIMRHAGAIAGRPMREVALGVEGGFAGALILVQFETGGSCDGDEVILGFTTDDIGDFFRRATAAGGKVLEDPHDPEVAGVKLVGFLADPEGHMAEVVQRA